MSKLATAKLIADIADIGARIWATHTDRSRDKAAKEARIKELETELAALKAKGGA